jgi:ElaA protein
MNQTLEWTVKKFEELTINELYDLLALRAEVFVVEQNCVYQDVDGKDTKALHVLGKENNNLVAYTRIFKPGDYFKEASIGRVVVSPNVRGRKLGYDLMKQSIEAVKTYFQTTNIHISAQCYLMDFYKNLGFEPRGESYLEDDIPHIAMFLDK